MAAYGALVVAGILVEACNESAPMAFYGSPCLPDCDVIVDPNPDATPVLPDVGTTPDADASDDAEDADAHPNADAHPDADATSD